MERQQKGTVYTGITGPVEGPVKPAVGKQRCDEESNVYPSTHAVQMPDDIVLQFGVTIGAKSLSSPSSIGAGTGAGSSTSTGGSVGGLVGGAFLSLPPPPPPPPCFVTGVGGIVGGVG